MKIMMKMATITMMMIMIIMTKVRFLTLTLVIMTTTTITTTTEAFIIDGSSPSSRKAWNTNGRMILHSSLLFDTTVDTKKTRRRGRSRTGGWGCTNNSERRKWSRWMTMKNNRCHTSLFNSNTGIEIDDDDDDDDNDELEDINSNSISTVDRTYMDNPDVVLSKQSLSSLSSSSSSLHPTSSSSFRSTSNGSPKRNKVNMMMKRRDVLALSSTTSLVSTMMIIAGSSMMGDPKVSFADEERTVATATTSATLVGEGIVSEGVVGRGIGTNPAHPIVIIGAGGKIGKLCLEILNRQGLYVKGVTRSGRDILMLPRQSSTTTTTTTTENNESDTTNSTTTTLNYVSYGAGDVTKYEQLKSSLTNASAVIFAASASGKNKGGDPAHVDYLGLYNTAKACLECEVPKLVVVSAGTVTRPDSIGFKATNLFVKYAYGDKIMDYKAAGEAAVRDLYTACPNKNLTYAIVRPGGLTDKPSIGSELIHVSQGDVYSSDVPREDVALVIISALLGGKKTDFTTFEVNQVEGLDKSQGNLPPIPDRVVHAGSPTFDSLLDGLLTDTAIKNYYPDLINDFRGSGIESIDQIMKNKRK